MKILITGGSGFIGTNLTDDCLEKGDTVLNVDWNPPLKASHNPFWKECDIMDKAGLQEIFSSFQPAVVIHLASRTDTDIYELDGDLKEYIQNHEGTKNVLECIKNTPSVERSVLTSTMFVCEAGYLPSHDKDYKPFTLYGVSKKIGEDYVREADPDGVWTIIRPQTIWGPWSLRYRDVMFKVMRQGLYFHPSKKNVYRAYGYVKNVVWQIRRILEADKEKVHRQVFYVGDRPLNLLDWVQCISRELTGKAARIIPTPLVKAIALTGDFLKMLNISFPLTSTRFSSMTEDYLTTIEKTFKVLGEPPYNIEQGVKEIVEWYDHESHSAVVPENKKLKVQKIPEPEFNRCLKEEEIYFH